MPPRTTGRTTTTPTSYPHPRSPPSLLGPFARSAAADRRCCGVIKLDVQDKGRNIGDAAALQRSNMDRVRGDQIGFYPEMKVKCTSF